MDEIPLLEDFSVWETVANDLGNVMAGCALFGACGVQIRKWWNRVDPKAAVAVDGRRKLTTSLSQVEVRLSSLLRRAALEIDKCLTVEDLRFSLSRIGLTTPEKICIWNEICQRRFAAAALWPVLTALAEATLTLEATNQVLETTEAVTRSAAAGGMVMGILTTQLLSQFASSGIEFGTLSSNGSQAVESMIANLAAVASAEVKKSCGPKFSSTQRVSSESLLRYVREAAQGTLLAAMSVDEINVAAYVCDPKLALTLRHDQVRSLVSRCAGIHFDTMIKPELTSLLPACAGFNATTNDAVCVQIVTQFGPLLTRVAEQPAKLPTVWRCFASAAYDANVARS